MKQAQDYKYDTALASYKSLTLALNEITTLWNETKFGNETAFFYGAKYSDLEQKVINTTSVARLNLINAIQDLYRSMSDDQRELADNIR
jgi:hypothetical protein